MANESDSESCIELVQVDCESVEGSTDNKLTEDDGAKKNSFYSWKVQGVKFGNILVSQHVTEYTYCELDKKKHKVVCIVWFVITSILEMK